MEIRRTLHPQDLVGCRYRRVLKHVLPDIPPTDASVARRLRLEHSRAQIMALLPTRPEKGDNRHFRRIDLEPASVEERWFATLEAIAAGAHVITNAVVSVVVDDQEIVVEIDALVRHDSVGYMPVLITNHRIARADEHKTMNVVATRRLGLGRAHRAKYRLKHHAADTFSLAAAARALDALGVGCQRAIIIGQDFERGFVLDTDLFQQGLDQALAQPVPFAPHRVKECGHCRYWPQCEQQLLAVDDISLLFSGEKSWELKKQGIATVAALAQCSSPVEDVALARAYVGNRKLLKKQDAVSAPRFDVEIDIDVEAYLDRGSYLWGVFDGSSYHPFVTWDELGSEAEARNFAEFWQWLRERISKARAAGQSVGVFCYSANGENHWLRFSAKRFAQFRASIPGVPSEEEVSEFISSPLWIDVFALVRRQLLGTHGLGLKTVAPVAGFCWQVDDLDGEASVNLYLEATRALSSAQGADAAREALLTYNSDDCRATARVRHFLADGAPGVSTCAELCMD
ncbi:MAG: TM0106 family RecB-like putative nuclease [Corynebacterium sp.]|uniref:TM0106 family RecB-like putative nuclease n=1 Tax=Corynebacterium sp. TaxID=1720 RepID=UPI0026DA80DB|nr:TM0106 family RecB-like putative nuclease [Corynebacterium sp.]MDO4761923.1 TM0106 family RecB-like putative nuclease [Corynebacterium sp.]